MSPPNYHKSGSAIIKRIVQRDRAIRALTMQLLEEKISEADFVGAIKAQYEAPTTN